ncbi:snRNA-activating protein complex subunit 1-like [Vanessa cardui]|uniref:snRNA-activating protein complex subunit 1-like n=1 Tax=Vanessa cardui TaxID=171605 RepID=UPI001F13AA16|nr:snRNA-activating protein complex subunit 1-like [Vanessa cardui]
MARYAHNIHQVHIADGFSSDCDELIHRCLKLQTLEYHSFCDIWKDLNFGMIYQGRSSGAEIAELSEEVIHIAKHYMIKDTSNFEESVAGLFLVYGLLTLQPFSGFACLRLVPEDVASINRIQVVARRERRLDVLFILGEVLVKYTQYHVAERDRGMESVLRKYLEGYTSIDKLGVRPRGVFYRQNEELDIIRDVGSITRQYTRAKNSLIGQGKQDASLRYINENLASELNTSLKRIINGIIDNEKDADDDDDDDEETTIDHYDNVQAIKSRAMTNTVNSIKHLTRIEERQTATKSPKKKSDLKVPTGKVKTGSPTKPVTTPRKRKAEPKSRNKKCKAATKKDLTDDPETIDIDLESFQKGVFVDNIAEEFGMEIAREQNLKIEDLPESTKTENQGRLIEIEVIDKAKKASANDMDITCADKSDVTAEDVSDTPSNSKATKSIKTFKRKRKDDTPETQMEFSDPNNTRKKNPRDLKRTKLKSKFKRMGMLPVANFNEQK